LVHRARKRFGQNFLSDAGIIQSIVRAIAPAPGQNLVEIGPGLGALTEQLLQATGGHLQAVELDRDLVSILRTQFFNYPDFIIHSGDALKFDFGSLAINQPPLRIVGNLPYNISTPLIFHLLEYADQILDMHFMLQKEVVDRLAAAPNSKAYGRLGVMVQYYCAVEPLLNVPPSAFKPQPKVQSAVVRLRPHQTPPCPADDPVQLGQLVRQAFGQRRKTLQNNLKGLVSREQMEQLDIDPGCRAETLALEDFVALSNLISSSG